MSLVKVQHAGQITLPADLRERFALDEGAYLEAEAIQDGILLKPVVDRAKAWEKVLEVMASVHAKQPPSDKTPLQQEEEIAEMEG